MTVRGPRPGAELDSLVVAWLRLTIRTSPAAASADGEAFSVMEPVRGLIHVGRRFYAAPRGQARVRRATDIILLAASLLALVGVVAAQPPKPLEVAVLDLVRDVPGWLAPVWAFLIGLLALWTAIVLVAPLCTRRPRITLEALLAVVARSGVGHALEPHRDRPVAGSR